VKLSLIFKYSYQKLYSFFFFLHVHTREGEEGFKLVTSASLDVVYCRLSCLWDLKSFTLIKSLINILRIHPFIAQNFP
jgi:hypothetical protein